MTRFTDNSIEQKPRGARHRCAACSRGDIRVGPGWASIAVGIVWWLSETAAWAGPVERATDVGTSSFWILATLTVFFAALTVGVRNPVTAAMSLVLSLFFTGGIYLTLSATFLAAIQVLVYAGAIMVLFMFVVMSVANYDKEKFGLSVGVPMKLIGSISIVIVTWRLVSVFTYWRVATPKVPDSFGTVRSLGELLFTDYLFPFEAISVLLLVAIVGAVMISRPAHENRLGQQHEGK